jgi:hypothetical protein
MSLIFWTKIILEKNGLVQIERWTSPVKILSVIRVKAGKSLFNFNNIINHSI